MITKLPWPDKVKVWEMHYLQRTPIDQIRWKVKGDKPAPSWETVKQVVSEFLSLTPSQIMTLPDPLQVRWKELIPQKNTGHQEMSEVVSCVKEDVPQTVVETQRKTVEAAGSIEAEHDVPKESRTEQERQPYEETPPKQELEVIAAIVSKISEQVPSQVASGQPGQRRLTLDAPVVDGLREKHGPRKKRHLVKAVDPRMTWCGHSLDGRIHLFWTNKIELCTCWHCHRWYKYAATGIWDD